MLVCVAYEKGGCSKSMLACHLAIYLQSKNNDVVLIDTDPQGSTVDWSQERSNTDQYPPVTTLQASGDCFDDLQSLKDKYDWIIVDTGGHDSTATRAAMAASDKCIIPVRPKRRDLKVFPKFHELLTQIQAHNRAMTAHVVLTQCPPLPSQHRRIDDSQACIESFELDVLPIRIFTRNAFDDSEEGGATVFEWNDDKAKSEMLTFCELVTGV